MNQIRKITQNQQIISFLIVTGVAFIVWMFGPYLMVHNQYVLEDISKRLYIILLLYLGLTLKIIFFDTDSTTAEPTRIPHHTPEAVKKLHALQKRFQGAVHFLKKTMISKHGHPTSLAQLPWFLLIGPQGAGKTSLLANANINFILSKQFKNEQLSTMPASETCDWWATRDLVMIDVPGAYIASKQVSGSKSQSEMHRASLPTILWHNLLNIIKKHRQKSSLSGVVISLHLPEIIKHYDSNQQKQIVHDIKYRINELRTRFNPKLPFYILITKCDLINGFQEFFSDSGSEELAQAWGISIPELKEGEKLLDVFTHRFNALIKRVNKQLIWRLHQERNPNARPYIKDFPLQIERIKDALTQFLKALNAPTLNLQGIYFTSATQTTSDKALTELATTHTSFLAVAAPAMPKRAYFIKQFILQGLPHQAEIPHYFVSPKAIWQRRAIYGTAAAIIITLTVLLAKDFQRGIQQTYAIQHDLTQYQIAIQQSNTDTDRLIKALPLLDALQQAATISQHQLSKLAYFLSFYSNKSNIAATAVYHNALQTIIIPEIKNHFEKYLQSAENKNPVQVYAVLKAYLMLNDAAHLDVAYITSTLKNLLSPTLPAPVLAELNSHIQNAFTYNDHSLSLNNDLILQIRKQLTSLSAIDLSYLILKNTGTNNQDSTISLGSNANDPSVFISKEVSNQIPNMFTAGRFNPVVNQEIPVAAEEAIQGNWVLGHDFVATAQPMAASNLTQQLRTKYIANYIDIWESLLANIRVVTPHTLAQINSIIKYITSNHSPLLEILKTIQKNTALPAIMAASPKLQTLNALLANANDSQENTLYHVFVSLQQLNDELEKILRTHNLGKAAFETAKARIQNATHAEHDAINQIHQIAEQSPEPLKSWLKNISTLSWSLILRETSHYIETNWQANVLATYNSELANRYPFAPNATQEVDLQKFIAMFSKEGVLEQFYQTYLKSFVDESGDEWQWRTLDNQKMPLNNAILASIQTEQKMQHSFFPNGDKKLYIQFTLRPMRLSSNVKSFNLTMNGQKVSYDRAGGGTLHTLGWPGNNTTQHDTVLNVVSIKNQLYRDSANGDWGWFRIVSKSVESVNTRKELLLNFSVENHAAKYLLYTQGQFNPFLPANLQKLHLPEHLEGG